jgi:hypothetical protein
MADPYTRAAAVLMSVSALGFLGAPFVLSTPYKFMPRGRAFLTRALSCVMSAGYFLASYVVLRDGLASGTLPAVAAPTAVLNLTLVILEWPYLKRRGPSPKDPV